MESERPKVYVRCVVDDSDAAVYKVGFRFPGPGYPKRYLGVVFWGIAEPGVKGWMCVRFDDVLKAHYALPTVHPTKDEAVQTLLRLPGPGFEITECEVLHGG